MATAQGIVRPARASGCRGAAGLSARDLLPCEQHDRLRANFSPRQIEYIAHVLTPDEICVISDLKDVLIIARIKRMSKRRLARFDRYVPNTRQHQREYTSLQARWLQDEQYLLGTQLGRSPTHQELFVDFMRNENGLRFRAFFVLKFPERMTLRPAKSCPAPA